MAEPHQNVAFLGLGLMGAAMAARLLEQGVPLTVWNRSPGKARALEALGATSAPNPAQAVKGSAVVCLCLTDADAVRSVVFGASGAVETLEAGAVVLDLSSIGPAETRAMAKDLGERVAAHWVDAPVSGGVAAARNGQLTVFCGGASSALAEVAPVLQRLAARQTNMGPLGAGQATKICNQLIVSANLLAMAEALSLARRLGLDPARLPEALQGGFADSRPLQIFGPRMTAAGSLTDKLGEIQTMRKDVANLAQAARAAGADLPLVAEVERLYARALDAGLGAEDIGRLIDLYPSANGAA